VLDDHVQPKILFYLFDNMSVFGRSDTLYRCLRLRERAKKVDDSLRYLRLLPLLVDISRLRIEIVEFDISIFLILGLGRLRHKCRIHQETRANLYLIDH
jgi:hypothetical protein